MPPVKMTRAEYEAKYGVKPVVSTLKFDFSPAPQRMTREEYEELYGVAPNVPAKAGLFSRTLSDIPSDVVETAKGFVGAAKTGSQNFAQNLGGVLGKDKDPDISRAQYATAAIVAPFSAAVNMAGEGIVGAAKLFTTDDFEKALTNNLGAVIEAASEANIPLVGKNAKEIYKNMSPENKFTLTKIVGPVANVVTGVTTGGVASKGVGVLADSTIPAVTSSLEGIGKRFKFNNPEVKNNKGVQSVADEIDKIENNNAVTRKANSYGRDVRASQERIAQSNVLKETNAVNTNGLIDTAAAVKLYRTKPITDNGLSLDDVEDVVRKNLENEGKKVNLNEVRNELRAAILDSGLEGGDLASAITALDKQIKGLSIRADEFGNVPLQKIHDSKIGEYQNINFNTPPEIKTFRKTVARAYKGIIEQKSDMPVKEINDELSKYYADITRLELLNGKRTEGGRLEKYSAQIAGTGIGMAGGSAAGGLGAAVMGMVGGELAAGMKGRAMANTFKSGVKGEMRQSPLLKDAKASADAGKKVNLKKPDNKVGAAKNIPKTPEIKKVEGQIARNVDLQKKAIKSGDFALVAQLKEIYVSLVTKLKTLIADYKKLSPADKQGGFFGGRPKGFPKKENDLDKKFRMQDKDTWDKRGQITVGTERIAKKKGKINLQQGNFLNKPRQPGETPNIKPVSVSSNKLTIGTREPEIKTKREVVAKDVSGNKIVISQGTALQPFSKGANYTFKLDGTQYTINKNQYQNLVGQSDVAKASPFAPELDGTVDSVRGARNLDDEIDRLLDDEMGEGMSREEARDFINQDAESDVATKYSQYTLDGGTDYREIVVQAPDENSVKVARRAELRDIDAQRPLTSIEQKEFDSLKDFARGSQKAGYISSHWDEPNPLFHIRANNRTFEGKKVSFMEEMQSDWARDARDGKAVPNNPLLKNWQIPATKKALMDAVDQGAERFAWINGAQTSERYKLSTQVENVGWQDTGAGLKTIDIKPKGDTGGFQLVTNENGLITAMNGSKRMLGEWEGKKLDEVLGKGMADSIMSKETGELTGEGLNFGGEWAINLYDKQVRDIVKKLTGAEVKSADMGLPIAKSKFDEFTLASGNNAGGFVTKNNLKKGALVTDKNGTEFEVYEVLEKGKFKALPSKFMGDFKVEKAQFSDKFKIKNNSTTFDSLAEAKEYAEDLKARTAREFTIDSGNTNRAINQYIDLTPEVIAKIKGKAPKFNMKTPSVGESLPLLLLMLGGGAAAATA